MIDKICCYCHNRKDPLIDFYNNRSKPDGLSNVCIGCEIKRRRNNRELFRKYYQKFLKHHPDYRKKHFDEFMKRNPDYFVTRRKLMKAKD